MDTTFVVPPFPQVAALARISPRTDGDLIHLTQGTPPNVADLACAVFHERIGAHAGGCDVCDQARVEDLAGKMLDQAARAGLLPRGFAILRRIKNWPVAVRQAVLA